MISVVRKYDYEDLHFIPKVPHAISFSDAAEYVCTLRRLACAGKY